MSSYVLVNQNDTQCGTAQEDMEMKSQNQAENGEQASVITSKRKPNLKVQRYGQIFLSEYVATSILLFAVCLGCMDGVSKTPLSPIQSPLTSGFAVATLVTIFGPVSDAHMNPAVTACFLALGKIDIPTSFIYLIAEMLGAVTGVGLLKVLVPSSIIERNPGHCETNVHPEMSMISGAIFEFFITSLLIFLVCGLVDVRNSAKQDSASIKFGLAVAGLSFAGGALTGASLNPARSFGPALWNGAWSGHWVYWVGPMAAGFLVPKIYQFLFEKDLTKSTDQ